MITIQLRRGKAESIKRFHPWIFSGAIQGTHPRNQHIEEGEREHSLHLDTIKLAQSPYASLALRK